MITEEYIQNHIELIKIDDLWINIIDRKNNINEGILEVDLYYNLNTNECLTLKEYKERLSEDETN